MSLKLKVILICMISLIISSCSLIPGFNNSDGYSFDSSKINNKTFTSTSISGYTPTADATLTIKFLNSELAQFSANCNILSGKPKWTDKSLSIENASETEIGCDANHSNQDKWFFGLILSGIDYYFNDDYNSLTLSNKEYSITFHLS